MGESGGFFVYDGTVKSLPCQVEDFVFTSKGDNLGVNYQNGESVYVGLNHLYEELTWFYPKAGSDLMIDALLTIIKAELGQQDLYQELLGQMLIYMMYLTQLNLIQQQQSNFPFNSRCNKFNGATIYYAHEVGTDQVDTTGAKTTIPAFIESGDFSLNIEGNGQLFMSMRRFVPDFKDCYKVMLKLLFNLRDYPSDTAASSPLGPFTITSTTDKIDTRARARFASLKIANYQTDENWRFGTFRADVQPDGMRG